ncbi:hypothetical protein IE53DRAFT_32278 [Violaceomyces palustris]|uniref:Uncharacterized protein n=1 Tax=Violaceomyces palustris TaxID=1673888 RepID=A0ACD0P7Q8_9BASI|nr:hypothetical protein IE53DRAFT_32278 [Violaceomyces palustris]
MPRAPKTSIRRVRSGCLTCKRRKLKCDEEKPSCIRCRNASRECSYTEQSLFPPSNQTEPPHSTTPKVALPTQDGLLFHPLSSVTQDDPGSSSVPPSLEGSCEDGAYPFSSFDPGLLGGTDDFLWADMLTSLGLLDHADSHSSAPMAFPCDSTFVNQAEANDSIFADAFDDILARSDTLAKYGILQVTNEFNLPSAHESPSLEPTCAHSLPRS